MVFTEKGRSYQLSWEWKILVFRFFDTSSIRIGILTSDRNRQGHPENRRILPWGTRRTEYVPREDKAEGDLMASSCFKKRNQREDNHINL